jgi:predicted enzyme related to lactoylglutathione lyase
LITHIETVAVYVSDQERAMRFYVDQLGFELRKDATLGAPGDGPRWIEVAPHGGQTVLVLFTPPGTEDRIGASSGLVLLCEDIQATVAELKTRGVEFAQEPMMLPSGWWASFQDPDGNQLGLSQRG